MLIKKSQLRKLGEHRRLIGDRTKPPIFADGPQWQSLVDLFHKFSKYKVECLQYDDGYCSWRYTYAQVGRAAQCFAAKTISARVIDLTEFL